MNDKTNTTNKTNAYIPGIGYPKRDVDTRGTEVEQTTSAYRTVKPHDLGPEVGYPQYLMDFRPGGESFLKYSEYKKACARYEYIEEIKSLVGEVEDLDSMSNQELRDLIDEIRSR